MRILVTGARGFVGSHCLAAVRRLAPHAEVYATTRGSGPRPADGVRWQETDLLDAGAIDALIDTVRPTHLLHAAWEATPVSYAHSPDNARWLDAGRHLLARFGGAGGRRFVGVGSSAEYGPSDMPCREIETPLLPATPYGAAKAEMGGAVMDAAAAHGFTAAWGRLFLPYGPGDPPQRLLPSLMTAFRGRRRLPMSDGGQQRDFIHAADAGAMLVALLLSDAGGSFNIG
ncbi:MAG: NAD-dependent epimerase/dehydratase family protein, partial [Beijerinckiaceae bacterium]